MYAKKSLGQHFLKSQKAILAMINSSEIEKGDFILEIGPGQGVLTEALLKTGCDVLAIEKDGDLVEILKIKFKKETKSGQLKTISGDILNFNFDKILPKKYKVVANIPYYITGQIIRLFLSGDLQPKSMTLLVQKEVAERIVTKNKKENLLSLSVKAYGEPKYIQTVPRGAFAPAPNVDSAIIYIGNISKKRFLDKTKEKKFFQLIHAGFAHKRKQILPNLRVLYGKERVVEVLTLAGIPFTSRAEDLDIETWFSLCDIMG
jgi:16S rRNA (adenine1518-N6/adenine1519-N6)-dimethyltransferase